MPAASSSSLGAGPSTSVPPLTENFPVGKAELDRALTREAKAFERDMEVERILKAFKLNPYDILDLPYFESSEQDVKKKYKHLSLFIHPDKATHEKAPDAFDLLKKAAAELSDADKRLDIDSTILFARTELLKSLSIPLATPDTDLIIKRLHPPYMDQLRVKVRELLIDEELRKRRAFKMNLVNEGLEAKKKEDETAAKKRKAEDDARWEENRDKRVEGWRSFATTGPKKKKKKVEVLG